MIQPPNIQPGDTIGLVCPAGSIPIEKVQNCIQTLEKWGYRVQLGKTVGSKKDCFSAADIERAEDLQALLDDENIKAIICARGGYGLSRIIGALNFSKFNAHPKWVVGFSDITVLHAALQRQNCGSIHGPMAAAFNKGEVGEKYIQSLRDCLEGRATHYQAASHSLNTMGQVKAPIIGGNLCMIAHLVGSKNALESTGKIIFIEDVSEYHYNIDRLMIQCKNAGLFENCKGLIIGGFTDLKDNASDFGATAYEIIAAHTKDLAIPICFDFPISHGLENVAIKQGQAYFLEVNEKGVSLREA
jgi:muramoyltetrapeptide carboxypeptidase